MNELGNISISSDVVATIAETVIAEVEGVYSLASSNSKNEIIKFFQNVSSNSSKGIEVEIGETECTLDLYVVAKYGFNLPALAGEIQREVTNAIVEMTGLKVQEVNVFIQKILKIDEEKKIDSIENMSNLEEN